MPKNAVLRLGIITGLSAIIMTSLLTAVDVAGRATQAQAASAPNGTISRSEVLDRAQNWVDRNVRYNTTRHSSTLITDQEGDDKYGPDCSGLVSMAWHTTANSGKGGNSTYDFLHSSDIERLSSMHDLRPGDAILRDGHMELFARWKDAGDHTKGAWTYSLNGTGDADSSGWQNDWAKGPQANSHGQRGDESWSSMTGNFIPVRYERIVDDHPTGVASVYGAYEDGRLTYTAIDVALGQRTLGAIKSDTTLGFKPKALATLNFNTLLVTEDGPDGNLYRVDIISNRAEPLTFSKPVRIGHGFQHQHLAYDGAGHLFGIYNGQLRRYTITTNKPTETNITGNTLIDGNFTLKTLTTTGPNWLLGTTTSGELISYHIDGSPWKRTVLRTSTWQIFDTLLSPGGGVYFAHLPDGAMRRYHDINPHDTTSDDLTQLNDLDNNGWDQPLLSAQPATIH
ncbi:hypothetical protein [Sphaerisporangium dianthi]|uniref:Uncharacterized protein n=1 Tax=Sphaerisporangium dianthi TaxID=1436120 RepID=A0ABV9C8Q9_9ACTN